MAVKHLDELTAAAKEGYRCQIVFVIQMNGIHMVFPNDDTQPEFGQALVRAAKAGVQVVYYSCHVEADSIRITGVGDDTSRYAGRLWRALNGRHPYRYFKDAINETGVAQKYYDFRSMTYLRMAEEWCREHKVRYFRKDGKN